MKLGVIFPQQEIGADPGGLREYFLAVEELGYDYVGVYDHILGADITNRPGWDGIYDKDDMFHEAFVLLAYGAALTTRIQLCTSIMVLGQRQTALVAKQAAAIDVLSNGRMRLGIGAGWNAVEYEALAQDFSNRGRRMEEQMEVLRALWTQESVTYDGRWHTIHEASINPLPVQRPIPIWIGGRDDRVLRRAGQLADGWLTQSHQVEEGQEAIDRLRAYATEAGRDPDSIGIEARVGSRRNTAAQSSGADVWRQETLAWRDMGATHLSFNAMRSGLQGASQHIEAIRAFKEAMPGDL
jgi:probable F420-dependent oxidoreductase